MTPDCQVVDVVFTKSIICSKKSFTYEEAQVRIDDPQMTDELTQSIRRLNDLAKVWFRCVSSVSKLAFEGPPAFGLTAPGEHCMRACALDW